MKRFFFILSLYIVSLCTCIATNITARQILDKAAAKINLSKGIYADFSISTGKVGTQNGSIAIKGKKFNARTSSAIVWFDGKTQWLYNKKNEEVNVSTPKSSQIASVNPYYFLTLYKKGYTITQTSTGNGYKVHLVGKNNSIKEAYIHVDRNYNIKQIKIRKGQQWITITVRNMRYKPYADSTFRFNSKDFPKAEIIDLR